MRIKYNYGYSNMYSQDIRVESEVVGAMSKPTSIYVQHGDTVYYTAA